MLTETFHSIAIATRKVFTNWRAMLLLAIVYASLLAALYFFLAVREASFGQVLLTFALAIAAPLLFFVLQSMVAGQTEEVSAATLL
jgi:ABC-type transport system involved in cytochrome c biogenesis permease component